MYFNTEFTNIDRLSLGEGFGKILMGKINWMAEYIYLLSIKDFND